MGATASAPAGQGPALAPDLLQLPPEMLALVLSKVGSGGRYNPRRSRRADVAALASTSTAMLRAVLESCTRARAFTVHPDLARCFSRMATAAARERGVSVTLRARLLTSPQAATWTVSLPLHAAALVCAAHVRAHGPVARGRAAFRSSRPLCVPPELLHAVTAASSHVEDPLVLHSRCCECDGCAAWHADGWGGDDPNHRRKLGIGHVYPLGALPEGMTALASLAISGTQHHTLALPPGWLPASSSVSLRSFYSYSTDLARLPPNLGALESVSIHFCGALAPDWLPASSAGRVTLLDVSQSDLTTLPEGLASLEVLEVNHCGRLAGEWLPSSSRARVRVLKWWQGRAPEGGISGPGLPQGMPALRDVRVCGCPQMIDDWAAELAARRSAATFSAACN